MGMSEGKKGKWLCWCDQRLVISLIPKLQQDKTAEGDLSPPAKCRVPEGIWSFCHFASLPELLFHPTHTILHLKAYARYCHDLGVSPAGDEQDLRVQELENPVQRVSVSRLHLTRNRINASSCPLTDFFFSYMDSNQ